jgi:beta-glucosidase
VGESYAVMTQILRNEWGFEGCAITDMAVALLTYYHAPEAVKAGTDYFDTTDATLYGGFFTEDELEEDSTLHAALRQAAHRILYTYVNSNAMNGTSQNVQIQHVTVWWQKSIIFVDAAIGIAALIPTLLYIYFTVTEKKKEEK